MAGFETTKKSPETRTAQRTDSLLEALGKRVVFLSQTPRYPLWVEQDVADLPQPLHPSIEQTIEDTREVLETYAAKSPDNLPLQQKLLLSLQMIVFTNQMPENTFPKLRYEEMQRLKDSFVASAEEQGSPLNYAQQLAVALDNSKGDVLQALNVLCFASRQYSRWHDSSSIESLPDMSEEEIMTEMKQWRSALLACKNADENQMQDVSGDTYYTWTHALARVIHGVGSKMHDKAGKQLFQRGTQIMRLTAHKIKKQKVPSDHRRAAEYGNAIGDAILEEKR